MVVRKSQLADYSEYSDAELIHVFETAPARVREILGGLNEEDFLNRARGSGTWSCQEIVMHLADSETLGAFRVRKTWSESGSDLPSYDERLWTSQLHHQNASSLDREEALLSFTVLRRSTANVFCRATSADYKERWGVHPVFGRLTLRNLLELCCDHDERHIDQILSIRQLIGKPIDYTPLLPLRLY